MNDSEAELYRYYERELTFIRQFAQEFARKYPATAGRLKLESNGSTDPHVERLIQAFSLLTGRIRKKIHDEFPELTTALFAVLYPHYLAPIPSMAVIQFNLNPIRKPEGFTIERDQFLECRHPEKDIKCRYKTGYKTQLWPIKVAAANLSRPPFPKGVDVPTGAVAALRIAVEIQGDLNLSSLDLDSLRFFLKGERETIDLLYELIFNACIEKRGGLVLRDPAEGSLLRPTYLHPRDSLAPVGFGQDEGLLPYPPQSFIGYRLLTEFFAFPYKFHFVDLRGIKDAIRSGYQKRFEIIIFLSRSIPRLEQDITVDTFRLGCTPVINLFPNSAEPIILSKAKSEYRIVPDVANRDGLEIYSVDQVSYIDLDAGITTEYLPFYALRHHETPEESRNYWYAERKLSTKVDFGNEKVDNGTEVDLNIVNLKFDPVTPSDPILVVRTTVTNRELPSELQGASDRLILELEAVAPLAGNPQCVQAPSKPIRPPMGRGAYWRLISHLSLNHLSLAHVEDGRTAFQELLRVYDFSDPEKDRQSATVTRQLIEGISSIRSRRTTARLPDSGLESICRGMEVTIEFDEEKYEGTGLFLFASVLERFLAHYTTINSFTKMVARTKRNRTIKTWPPRAGDQQLI